MSGRSAQRRSDGPNRRTFLAAGTAAGAGAALAAATPAWAHGNGRDGSLTVHGLRVDDRSNALGIGNARPTFSWLLTGAGTDREQRAFQVRVASSIARLRSGHVDLWDSGRVESTDPRTAYDGAALGSRSRALWQVRVWDENGRPSRWSPVATFELGLLSPSDWTAGWIGNAEWDAMNAPVPPAKIELPSKAQGRYLRLEVTRLGLPLKEGWPQPVSRLQLAEVQLFDSARPDVDIAKDAAVTASEVYSAPGTWEPQYLTDGKTSGDTAPIGYTSMQHFDQDISSSPITLTFDLGTSTSFDRLALWPRTDTRTADGRTPNFPEDFSIQVADAPDGPYTTVRTITGQAAPEPAPTPTGLPLFARQFDVPRRVRSARLYITGLGVYTATINGRQTSNAVLEPGNTTYSKHLDYATVDVTDLLHPGANAIGVALGTGIYDTLTYNTRYAKFNARIGPPKLLAQLELTYADGSQDTISTDSNWRTTLGPTTFSNWYGGEDYDARRLPAGWDEPGTDLSGWDPVSSSSAPAPSTVLTARSGPAVEGIEVLVPQKITQPKPGVYVFDLGVNIAGWQHLTVRGPAGTQITMRPAELLHPDGTIDYGSTGNPIYDVYTLSGNGTETWHPEFIYHGFQYLQVEGLPSAPDKNTITASVLHAANPVSGSFTCSNDVIEGTHRIINRAVQGNMFSVLTDCPQREKLGWMEQDHLAFDTVARNYDIAAYGRDLVQAMADAQLDNGLVPDIAPEYTVFGGGFRDDPNWGNSMVLVPWNLYRTYGERDVLAQYYPNMTAYVGYLTSRASGHLLDYGLGDWATINASTPTGVTATYGYYKAADALASIAQVLGKTSDADSYAQLANSIRSAFHEKYYDAAHNTYATGSQTSDALALDMNAMPADDRDAVLAHLVENLRQNGYHLNLGEIGLPALFDVLYAAERNDVIYEIATQTTAPSYGAMLARGATSLTEFWDGGGSQNHFMLGAIDKWFSFGLAGIDQAPGSVGYTELVIAPAIVGDLTHVAASYRTPNGVVRSEWVRKSDRVALDAAVPVGTHATIRLPGRPDVRVGSGTYHFTTQLPG